MHSMKGQFQEMLSFVALAVMISIFLVLSTLVIKEPLSRTLALQSGLHEREDLRSGAAVVLGSTYGSTGITMMELAGLAAFTGNTTLDFGPVIGKVSIEKEIEKRMDALYGKGKWHVQIPFPEEAADIQIAIVADTSGSMCDDVADIRDDLPGILNSLKGQGRKAEVTVYLLPGAHPCNTGSPVDVLTCTTLNMPETDEFNCKPVEGGPISDCRITGSVPGTSSETWADGGACAARHGPRDGWRNGTVRIVMPLSDELPGGSDCGSATNSCSTSACDSSRQRSRILIDAANGNDVKVFPLMANPCGTINGLPGNGYVCTCRPELEQVMTEVASRAGGIFSPLSNSTSAADTIGRIIGSVRKQARDISLGTDLSEPRRDGTDINAYEVPIPLSSVGKYTRAYFYKWS